MNEKKCEDRACIPFFVHENTMMHYNRVNKRMLILFCVWCVTIAVIIGIFVQGNTVREKQLIRSLESSEPCRKTDRRRF